MKKQNLDNTDDFGVYVCYRPHVLFPRMEKVVVLAVDIQAALSTVPRATHVERIDGPGVHVVINKAVLAMFRDHANKPRRKKSKENR